MSILALDSPKVYNSKYLVILSYFSQRPPARPPAHAVHGSHGKVSSFNFQPLLLDNNTIEAPRKPRTCTSFCATPYYGGGGVEDHDVFVGEIEGGTEHPCSDRDPQ